MLFAKLPYFSRQTLYYSFVLPTCTTFLSPPTRTTQLDESITVDLVLTHSFSRTRPYLNVFHDLFFEFKRTQIIERNA